MVRCAAAATDSSERESRNEYRNARFMPYAGVREADLLAGDTPMVCTAHPSGCSTGWVIRWSLPSTSATAGSTAT